MRSGERHKNAKSIVITPSGKKEDAQTCEKCRFMSVQTVMNEKPYVLCRMGHDLEPKGCDDFKDASRDSKAVMGGTTGIYGG